MPQGRITVETLVHAPVETAWKVWTEPAHVMQWCAASPDWEAPRAENDLRVGGRFVTRMQAKDGSAGFDFGGEYTAVEQHRHIAYRMDNQREVVIDFAPEEGGTRVTETFDMEQENSEELQRQGWQSILDNYARHAEGQA